jgi:hypothetical protein
MVKKLTPAAKAGIGEEPVRRVNAALIANA